MTDSTETLLTYIQGTEKRGEPSVSTAVPSDTEESFKLKRQPFSKVNFLVHHDTHPLTLDIIITAKYGVEWFGWEPETLWKELMEDFRSSSISDHVRSKVQAVKTAHITDWVFTKWEVFCPIVQALNNNIPDFKVLRRPLIGQLMVAVDILTMIRTDTPFSAEVQQFCAASFLDQGVCYAPQPVAFCQDEILEYLKLRNIECDISAIKNLFKVCAAQPPKDVVLTETNVDTQVSKLLFAYDYLQFRRDQLQSQLEIMRGL